MGWPTLAVFALAVLVTTRSNGFDSDGASGWGGGTVTVAEAVLLSGSVSRWSPRTVAVLVIAPGVPHVCAVTSTCADPSAASPPRSHDGSPPVVEHDPWLGLAATSVSPVAIGSLTLTPVASLGPWLRTTSVYITCPPPAGTSLRGGGLVIDRSMCPSIGAQLLDASLP